MPGTIKIINIIFSSKLYVYVYVNDYINTSPDKNHRDRKLKKSTNAHLCVLFYLSM